MEVTDGSRPWETLAGEGDGGVSLLVGDVVVSRNVLLGVPERVG